jgi:hypothetical protein
MLPTHAKRLAQEQWEREGRTGTVYDREFRLLNTESFPENSKRNSTIASETDGRTEAMEERLVQRVSAQSRASGQRASGGIDSIKTTVLSPAHALKWGTTPPLGSPASLRPGTSGTDREHGGYRTMPPIAKPVTPNGDAAAANQASPAPPPIRIANLDEEDVGKKGACCGCVVM